MIGFVFVVVCVGVGLFGFAGSMLVLVVLRVTWVLAHFMFACGLSGSFGRGLGLASWLVGLVVVTCAMRCLLRIQGLLIC